MVRYQPQPFATRLWNSCWLNANVRYRKFPKSACLLNVREICLFPCQLPLCFPACKMYVQENEWNAFGQKESIWNFIVLVVLRSSWKKNGNQGRVQCQVFVVVSFPCFTLGYWAITEVPHSWWHLLQSRTLRMHSCEYTDLCLLLLGMRTMNKVYMCAFPHSWVLGRASKAVQRFSKLQRTWFCYMI